MEIGETWGYRERANDSACPLIPAEVLQFGPPRSHKVRVVMRGGEYSGLDMWVPKVRLRVLGSRGVGATLARTVEPSPTRSAP